jgi:hypothetical protein|tara:strand:- start:53 stop:652 length:600 start_codon:yes stop_codon:yes gene_type:complete
MQNTPTTMTSIADFQATAKDEINRLVKPLTAYQLYNQKMREDWSSMSDQDKLQFTAKAKVEKDKHEEKKQSIEESLKEEVKKLKLFLRHSGDRVPCVGLDNGFSKYTIIGPMDKIELFTESEKQKLINKGVPEKYIGKYKSVGGRKFNWRAARKWDITVYGGSQNYRPCWGSLLENYEGKTGEFTSYNNYKGETWTENH